MLDPIATRRLADIRQQEILHTAATLRQAEWPLARVLRSILLFGHALTPRTASKKTQRAPITASQEMRAVTR
jgi:hypothetical protein